MNQMNLNDVILKNFIDQVFDKYDTDRSGTLDPDQMTLFFNDLFKTLNISVTVTKQQSLAAIKQMDQNGDGYADKKQLFDAFKVLLNKPKPNLSQSYTPPSTNPQYYPPANSYPPYQPQNPYGVYNPYTPPPQYPYMQQPNMYNPYMSQPYNNTYNPANYGPYNGYNNPYNQGNMGGSVGPRGSGWGKNR